MRFDTSMESLSGIGRSESFAELNNPEFSRTLMGSTGNLFSGENVLMYSEFYFHELKLKHRKS